MIKKIMILCYGMLLCVFMSVPSFAESDHKEKEYRIYIPFFIYSTSYDIRDYVDKGIVRLGWGCNFYVALAERDKEFQDESGESDHEERAMCLAEGEQMAENVSWRAILPDGTIKVYQGGSSVAVFRAPFEMTGCMTIVAFVDGLDVARFDVTVVGTYMSGESIKGWIGSYDEWYYVNDNGSLARGWFRNNGKWYYLNQEGLLQTGWQYLFQTERNTV